MSGPYLYLYAHDVDGAVNELIDRLRQSGLDMREWERDEHAIDQASLAFVDGQDAEGLSSASARPGILHIVVDDNPPQYFAGARNVMHLTPHQVLNDDPAFRMGLERIVHHLLGEASAEALAIPMDDETQKLFDGIRRRDDDERARVEAEQKVESKRNRLLSVLDDPVWGDFLKLIDRDDWRMETGQAYVAARHAERLAEEAAEVARDELGKSFNHTVRDEDLHRRRWGRIRYMDHIVHLTELAVYEGETDGVDPHGYGELRFSDKRIYRGQFVHGARTGYGVGYQGHYAWFGMWSDDEPMRTGVFGTQKQRGAWTYVPGDYLQQNMSGVFGWVFRKAGPLGRGLLRSLGGDV